MKTDNANKYLNERQIYQRDVWDSKGIEHPLDSLLEDYHQEQLKLIGTVDVSATVDINTQVEILNKVINKLMISFDDENDRMDYILDICNEYRKEAKKQQLI